MNHFADYVYGHPSEGDATLDRVLAALNANTAAIRVRTETKALRAEQRGAVAYATDLVGSPVNRGGTKTMNAAKQKMLEDMFGKDQAARLIAHAESATKELEGMVAFKAANDSDEALETALRVLAAFAIKEFREVATSDLAAGEKGSKLAAILSDLAQSVGSAAEAATSAKERLAASVHDVHGAAALPYLQDIASHPSPVRREAPSELAARDARIAPYLRDLGQLGLGRSG